MRWLTWLAAALSITAALTTGGCAADEDDDAVDLEEGEQTEDALSNHAIQGYAPVSPPEQRVATGRITPTLGPAIAAGRKLAAIRTLTFRGAPARLVVDGDSYATSLVTETAWKQDTREARTSDRVEDTPYAASLAALARSGGVLRKLNAEAPTDAREPFTLTVDMCPSRKAWDADLFDWVVSLSGRLGKPVPIGIAMTGDWAKRYPNELAQLDTWGRTGKLSITWINHSSTHPVRCVDDKCRRALFLTASNVNFDEEVLGEERVVLARGIVPSVLFRFPGLTQDARTLGRLGQLSLLPIDANGWIAKGQPITPDAVVLVHGNGNERPGITGFLQQVRTTSRAAALASGQSELVSPLFVVPSLPR